MLKNRFPLLYSISAALLFSSSNLVATGTDPLPLSGLNLEDFKAGVKNDLDWQSNPFVQHGDNPTAKQMTLKGVIFGPHKAMALINSETVKVGDKIGSSEVVSIHKQKVILRNDDGLYQITMKGTPNEKT